MQQYINASPSITKKIISNFDFEFDSSAGQKNRKIDSASGLSEYLQITKTIIIP